MTILEVWADTGNVVERERTQEEQTQYEADVAEGQAAALAAEAAEAATKAAIAHAKSLGFTDDMIAVLYPAIAP